MRRQPWVHFHRLTPEKHDWLVVRILTRLSAAANLGLGTLAEGDMPDPIAPAAECQFGRVCQLVVAAILQVIRDEKEPTALL
ncbi:hypothetical protein ACQVP2_16580 [Methylobacterium aquaticum]|uniref:hypothetical protein n=1 Tax=Methylobacterium aquaticum TaxID=270351 RepID=UPI003D172A8E